MKKILLSCFALFLMAGATEIIGAGSAGQAVIQLGPNTIQALATNIAKSALELSKLEIAGAISELAKSQNFYFGIPYKTLFYTSVAAFVFSHRKTIKDVIVNTVRNAKEAVVSKIGNATEAVGNKMGSAKEVVVSKATSSKKSVVAAGSYVISFLPIDAVKKFFNRHPTLKGSLGTTVALGSLYYCFGRK